MDAFMVLFCGVLIALLLMNWCGAHNQRFILLHAIHKMKHGFLSLYKYLKGKENGKKLVLENQ